MISHSAGERRDLCDQCPASRNGTLPWSTKAFVRKVREGEHHDDVSAGIFVDEFSDNNSREWTKQALTTVEDVTEAYMV